MRIALFCSSRNTVPPKKTGGTEQPIFYLAKGLARRGHKVTLYAAKNSCVPGLKVKEISPFALGSRDYFDSLDFAASFYDLTALADFFKKEAKNFDVIQFNSFIFYEILPFVGFSKNLPPVVIRLNHSFSRSFYPFIKERLKKIKGAYYLPISRFIKTSMPDLPHLKPIYPAVDLNDFKFCDESDDYLLFIGRLCPKKGAHLAIKAARKAGKKLIIAGKIDEPPPHSYFKKSILPYVDNRNIIYVGEVGYRAKIRLYRKALATLFPIQRDEAFGNVQIESMACGTPVIAFDRAACREAIKDGESGFIVKDGDINKMAAAVKNIQNLDRLKARKWTEDNFSISEMIKKYEDAYQLVIGKNKIKKK
jgi:glycosyltransferase involved in cell wall biosynthesis